MDFQGDRLKRIDIQGIRTEWGRINRKDAEEEWISRGLTHKRDGFPGDQR
jgi:hypothetical protein